MRRGRVLAVGLLMAGLAGCEDVGPEATRVRGGGPGADVHNRPAEVLMHAGSEPFWQTPDLIPVPGTGLDGARDLRRDPR